VAVGDGDDVQGQDDDEGHVGPAETAPAGEVTVSDEVLEAVDALLVALRESTERNQVETRRAQTLRRLRSHRRTYGEILGRVAASLTRGVTPESADDLVDATKRLHVAEVRALKREGMGVDDIAVLSGLTPHDVTIILSPLAPEARGWSLGQRMRPAEHPDGRSSPNRREEIR
jgi:hypothetical protein